MSRIVISLAGKGREHAYRALAIIELLGEHHDLLLIAPQGVDAHVLRASQEYSRVELFQIPLSSVVRRSQPTQPSRRTVATPRSLFNFVEALSLVENRVQRFAPDLLIAGFEPLLPRIGRRLSIRTICVDYQHLLEDLDLRSVPLGTRLPLAALRFASRVFCPPVDQHVVSSFHTYPTRQRAQVKQTPLYRRISVLLRKELQVQGSRETHLLVKLGTQSTDAWLERLIASSLPARVYGLARKDSTGQITFRDSTETFADDLLTCAGVITDASNQLIGEALACGKPVLAIPSQSDYHQRISALFLRRNGLAGTVPAQALTEQSLREFYECSASSPSTAIPTANDELLSIIESHLLI